MYRRPWPHHQEKEHPRAVCWTSALDAHDTHGAIVRISTTRGSAPAAAELERASEWSMSAASAIFGRRLGLGSYGRSDLDTRNRRAGCRRHALRDAYRHADMHPEPIHHHTASLPQEEGPSARSRSRWRRSTWRRALSAGSVRTALCGRLTIPKRDAVVGARQIATVPEEQTDVARAKRHHRRAVERRLATHTWPTCAGRSGRRGSRAWPGHPACARGAAAPLRR